MSKLTVRDYAIIAGVPLRIDQPGSFFQLMDSSGAVNINVLRADSIIGTAEGVTEGFSFGGPNESLFYAVEINSASTQTLKICFATGSVDLRQVVGNVAITSITNNGAVSNTSLAVTAAAQNALAANSARRFLFLQNPDPVIDMWFRADGNAAAAAPPSIKLAPGDSKTYDVFAPTGAVSVIGSGVGTVNLVIEAA